MRQLPFLFWAIAATAMPLWPQSPLPPCTPGAQTAAVLEEHRRVRDRFRTGMDMDSERIRILREAVRRDPDDFFLRKAHLEALWSRSMAAGQLEAIARQDEQLATAPDDPLLRYLAAYARIGRRSAEALERLERLARDLPQFAWAHLAIATVHQYPAFSDPAKMQSRALAFHALCPDSLEPFEMLQRTAAAPTLEPAVSALRRLLEGRTDLPAIRAHSWLWTLEFKVTPPGGHPALRTRLARDLARLRPLAENDYVTAKILRGGARQAGDSTLEKELEAIEDKLLPVRIRVLDDQENRQKLQGADRLARIDEMLRLDPNNFWLLYEKMGVVSNEKDWIALGEAALAAAKAQEEVWFGQSADLTIGAFWAEKGVASDRLVAMADRGLAHLTRQQPSWETSDLMQKELRETETRNLTITSKLQALGSVVRMYQRAGALDKTRQALIEAEDLLRDFRKDWEAAAGTRNPVAMRARWEYPNFRHFFLLQKAELALAAGSKPDALVWWAEAARATHDAMGGGSVRRERIFESARAVWDQLGGSAEGWQRWIEQTAPLAASPAPSAVTGGAPPQAWRKVERRLPAGAGKTLGGAAVSANALVGKVTFINVWATWCEPCRHELPAIQKLHERLSRAGTDAQVVTFNTDLSIGLVAPFVTTHKYTFPVWLAQSLFEQMKPDGGIPVNWIAGRDGVIRWESTGFGGMTEEKWLEAAMAKIEETTAEQTK